VLTTTVEPHPTAELLTGRKIGRGDIDTSVSDASLERQVWVHGS
jgi:hypothetical protein